MSEIKKQQGFFANFWSRMTQGMAGKKLTLGQISEYGAWAETINPLRGLTEQRARDIFDDARRGIYADLAYIYQEIEAADPTLLTCTERRESVVGESKWKIIGSNPERTRGYEENLANEQKDFLYQAYGRADDAMPELAEHLARGFFRGFAHARPIYGNKCLDGFEYYDQWNFAFDKMSKKWWWNPDATPVYGDSFSEIPDGELISLVRTRHIDYPALLIFIRAALGEKKYGIFLERYGIPPVTVIMPQDAGTKDEEIYFESAEKLAQAGSGALPYGSEVHYATDARSVNPFLEFLRHQQELIVLMATGGTLTTLASPTGIGSGASDAQEKVWRQITGRDLRAAGRATNQRCTVDLLAMEFPGQPVLAMFQFDADPSPTATQVFEDAAAAKQGGYLIEQKELEEASGYTLVLDTSNSAPGGQMWPMMGQPAAINTNALTATLNKAQNTDAKPMHFDATPKDDTTDALNKQTPRNASDAVLENLGKSLSADLAPVAQRIAALLDLPEAERIDAAKQLANELPGLLPDDPEMAAIMESELANVFAQTLQTKRR